MTDKTKVEEAIADLAGAVLDNDEKRAMGAFGVLVGGALVDLNRIANAVEKLASFELTKVADVVLAKATETALENGPSGVTVVMSLTTEESETIEALRRGDIAVVAAHTPPAPPAPTPAAPLCPICKAPVVTTERRPDGFSYCNNGHKFKTADAITR